MSNEKYGISTEARLSETTTYIDEKTGSPTDIDHDNQKFHDVVLAEADTTHEVGLDLYLHADQVEYTEAEAKKVLRKIDLRILPAFCMTQGLSILDKSGINYGNLFGMRKAQGITTQQYAWYASTFYIAYLFSTWPASILLQKYPTGKVMGTVCFFWGITCACMAAVHNFGGGIADRLILGCLESAVTPGLGLMTPMWYTLSETPVRHESWYSFNGVGSTVGDLIAYGVGHITHSAVPQWGLIFVIFGTITAVWGVYLLIFIPDSPASARFLTPHEKVIAIKRVAGNRTGTKNTVFKQEQVREAFRDPKLYILFVAGIAAQIPNGVVSNFSSIIISGFGFTVLQTTLLDIPSNVFQILSLMAGGYIASHYRNSRTIVMTIGNVTCIVAACALTYAPRHETWGRLVAFWFTAFQSVGFSMSMVMISANIGGYTKRQTFQSVLFIGYCVGNIAGPHVLISSEEAEGYPTATKAMLAGYVVKTVMHASLGIYMFWQNKMRDRVAREAGEVLSDEERAKRAEELGMTDTTELNNPYFRYAL